MDVPGPHSDVCLNPYDALLMEHGVTLPNELHNLIPGAIQSGASTVHGVFDATLSDHSLNIGDLRRDRS
jgi:hypothetical protein